MSVPNITPVDAMSHVGLLFQTLNEPHLINFFMHTKQTGDVFIALLIQVHDSYLIHFLEVGPGYCKKPENVPFICAAREPTTCICLTGLDEKNNLVMLIT